MHAVRAKSVEASPSEVCPLCGKDHWCFLYLDGSVTCRTLDIPPQGWIRGPKQTADGFPIFHPVRNKVKPRLGRQIPKWDTRGTDDQSQAVEEEIYYDYSDTQRVCRRQWSDRRKWYHRTRQGKPVPAEYWKNKMVIPQYFDGDKWQWGKGPEKWPLYQIQDVQSEDVLFFVGGEQCVDKLRSLGFSATCHQGGEGSYTQQIVEELDAVYFMMLVIIPDNDEHGLNASDKLAEACKDAGIPTAVLMAARIHPDADEKWDVADWDLDDDSCRMILEAEVAALKPECKDIESEAETADQIERAVSDLVKIKNPARQIVRQRKLMAEFNLRPMEMKQLKKYVTQKNNSRSDSVADLFQEIYEASENVAAGKKTLGVPTGFPSIDNLVHGFHNGRLITVAGRPGMGKSSFALTCAMNIAKTGKKVVLFSYEMSQKELMYRLVSMLIGVPQLKIASGNLDENEWVAFTAAFETLKKLNLVIVNPAMPTVEDIEVEIANRPDTDAVFIDYLQLMTGAGDSPVEIITSITKALKQNALSWDIPIILLSQLNRDLTNRSDKRPILADLRGSGSIEQDSDQCFFIHREEEYEPHCADRGVAEINIAKSRGTAKGMVKLLFKGEHTTFTEFSELVV